MGQNGFLNYLNEALSFLRHEGIVSREGESEREFSPSCRCVIGS